MYEIFKISTACKRDKSVTSILAGANAVLTTSFISRGLTLVETNSSSFL